MAAAKDKTLPAPQFGTVEPPRRRRRGGFEVPAEVVETIKAQLESADGEGWVSDNIVYETMGKAQAASHRYRQALVDDKYIAQVSDVKSRVWQSGKDKEFMFAIRLPDETAEADDKKSD